LSGFRHLTDGQQFVPIRRVTRTFINLLHFPRAVSFNTRKPHGIFTKFLIDFVNGVYQFMLLFKSFVVEQSLGHFFCRNKSAQDNSGFAVSVAFFENPF
jgi:hypothetical protein